MVEMLDGSPAWHCTFCDDPLRCRQTPASESRLCSASTMRASRRQAQAWGMIDLASLRRYEGPYAIDTSWWEESGSVVTERLAYGSSSNVSFCTFVASAREDDL